MAITMTARRMAYSAIALAMLMFPGAARAASDADQPSVRQGFADMRYGQLHYIIAKPAAGAARALPLVMFHQSPLSAQELRPLVAEMGTDRVAIGIDTPGQGSSDGPKVAPTIQDYAAAVDEALRNLGYGPNHPIDVFGNHTGSFIAAELAIREPKMVRKVILTGVYLVPEDRRLKAIAHLSHPLSSAAFFQNFCSDLPVYEKYYVEQGRSDSDWGALLVDSLRPLTRREYGHEAAFAYAATLKDRLPKVTQPVLLIALNDGLEDPTKNSLPLFQHAELIDLPNLHEGAFGPHAAELGAIFRKFLQ